MQDHSPQHDQPEVAVSLDDDNDGGCDGSGGAPYGSKSGHRITPQQKLFARHYVLSKGNQTAAAIAAGYKSPAASGHKLMHHAGVLAEIKRLSVMNIEGYLPKLIQKALDIATDDETPPELAIRTILALMDRAGLRPKSGPLVQVNNTTNDNRQITFSPQDVLRQLDEQRTAKLSGISASMTDNARARVIAPATPARPAPMLDHDEG
jgi:hypothetical protein